MVGSRLKVLRAHIGCSQGTMACAMRISHMQYGRYERGTGDVGAKEIERLKFFGVSAAFLFGETDSPFAVSKDEFMMRFNDAVRSRAE